MKALTSDKPETAADLITVNTKYIQLYSDAMKDTEVDVAKARKLGAIVLSKETQLLSYRDMDERLHSINYSLFTTREDMYRQFVSETLVKKYGFIIMS